MQTFICVKNCRAWLLVAAALALCGAGCGVSPMASNVNAASDGQMPTLRPEWIRIYPGSTILASDSSRTRDGMRYSVVFSSKDSATTVLGYFQSELSKEGYEVSMDDAITLQAKRTGTTRSLTVVVQDSPAGAQGRISGQEMPEYPR